MSTRQSGASDMRTSNDPHGNDDDVEMKEEMDDGDLEANSEGESPYDLHRTIQNLSTYLCSVQEDGEEVAAGFQRIPNRRVLPDYFEVISAPVAFSTIRGKILRKQYVSFSDFVKDVAQICHNAQVYNRPSAPIFGAAVRLREIFRSKLQELVARGDIAETEAELPDLGELPPVEDSPPVLSDVEDIEPEDEDEDEDDEDDEEADESEDDDAPRRRRRGRARISGIGRRAEADKDEDAHKKRGRPPSVLTPLEARISSILKGLRKPKDENGNLLILAFEKLPDKTLVTDYYQAITSPIALDNIKKKAKRKKYQSVDHVLSDIDLMFENAKLYNEDDSPVHRAAVELQQQARALADQEKAKSDDDFRDEDGKLPLAEIQGRGEIWKVGDWVHIRNPNDLGKPIVAQIYRMWQGSDGQKWINACWYYRPEQTVHRFDKHFFDHEVVKTGQYRDHLIEDVLDRCFVMFVTRFGRGRPRGLASDKKVYVCESRYNEEKFRFNKIKTWASCVPDEVRERDYEMDLFDAPHRMRKMPSPVKHLLREDAKDTDDLPKPTWGSPNAPPIVGAVHRRPRESNESPPPEPTPPPPAAQLLREAPESASRPSLFAANREHLGDTANRSNSAPFSASAPSPSAGQFQTHSNPLLPSAASAAQGSPLYPPSQPPHTAHQLSTRPIQFQQTSFSQAATPNYAHPSVSHAPPQPTRTPLAGGYNQSPAGPSMRSAMAPVGGPLTPSNVYTPPRPSEVYTLPDNMNEVMPLNFRHNFHHDSNGRVLFFTAPPLNRTNRKTSLTFSGLGHSSKYLAERRIWLIEREEKRKERRHKFEAARKRQVSQERESSWSNESGTIQAAKALERYFTHLKEEAGAWQKAAGLDEWRLKVET